MMRGILTQRQISRRETVDLTSPARSDGPGRRGQSMGQIRQTRAVYVYNILKCMKQNIIYVYM